MTKKTDCLNRYPGLRLLRSLTLGYHLPPFQGLDGKDHQRMNALPIRLAHFHQRVSPN